MEIRHGVNDLCRLAGGTVANLDTGSTQRGHDRIVIRSHGSKPCLSSVATVAVVRCRSHVRAPRSSWNKGVSGAAIGS